MTGPVQVLVVGFDRPTFSGEVMAELDRLSEAGTVRLLDVLLLERAEDGAFETLPLPVEAPPGLGTLAAGILGGADAEATARPVDGFAWSLADAIPPGATAAVALIEHLWAVPLRDAIHRAGGTPLEETWLAREDVQRLTGLVAQRDS
jgi:Family of unknown function (DUF6325)